MAFLCIHGRTNSPVKAKYSSALHDAALDESVVVVGFVLQGLTLLFDAESLDHMTVTGRVNQSQAERESGVFFVFYATLSRNEIRARCQKCRQARRWEPAKKTSN
jgi:hypothetical protein